MSEPNKNAKMADVGCAADDLEQVFVYLFALKFFTSVCRLKR